MKYLIDRDSLFKTLSVWNRHLKRRVHVIACGGTALTLLNIKESTKDIDFMVPVPQEYSYLIKMLQNLGYELKTGTGWAKGKGFIFDLFQENLIFTTELLESPLREGNNILLKEYSYICLGVLNFYDLIISKLFRFHPIDVSDCEKLYEAKKHEIDLERLKTRFIETSSYDIADEKHRKNFEYFLKQIGAE